MALSGFSIDPFSLLLGLSGGIAVIGLFCLRPLMRLSREKAMLETKLAGSDDQFRLMAQQALHGIQENFLVLASEKLKAAQNDGAHDLDKRHTAIAEMFKPLQKHLENLGGSIEQIKGTDQALRNDLSNLTRETARLSGALRDTAAQGRWGEYMLERVVEKSGLIKGVHYITQESIGSQGHRPDMIINLNNELQIVIDAKTPLNNFVSENDAGFTEDEGAQLRQDLAAQVRMHIGALSKKGYWESLNTTQVDFTILFLPSEQLFSMAMRGDPALLELAHAKNIVIASPTILMGLARMVRLGWRQADLAANAQEISKQGGEVYKRLVTFLEHIEKTGKGLSSALDGYNRAIGSLERNVLPAARKMQELGIEDAGKQIPTLTIIEDMPRRLTGTDND